MVDIRNRNLTAVADVAEAEPAIDDLEWYGFDPAAPTPMDEELPTEEVDNPTLLSEHILDQPVLWLIHYKSQIVMDLRIHTLPCHSTRFSCK